MQIDKTVRHLATALAVGCVLLVVGTLLALGLPEVRTWLLPATSNAPGYVVGESIDVQASLYAQSQRTLMVFARSSCGSCQRAKPLLVRTVSAVQGTSGWDVRMISTGQDEGADFEYAREIGIEPSKVTRAPLGLRLARVPAVVVVDRSGLILFSQDGLPVSPLEEEDMIRGVSGAGQVR